MRFGVEAERHRSQSRTRQSKFDFIKLDAFSVRSGWMEQEINQEALCETRCFMIEVPAGAEQPAAAAPETVVTGAACQGRRGFAELEAGSEYRLYCRTDLVAGFEFSLALRATPSAAPAARRVQAIRYFGRVCMHSGDQVEER